MSAGVEGGVLGRFVEFSFLPPLSSAVTLTLPSLLGELRLSQEYSEQEGSSIKFLLSYSSFLA